MNKSDSLVYFDHVSKGFQEGDRQRDVLTEATVGFEAGRFTAILGPSGSGKSTLLNLASGIEQPDAGDIWIDGQAINRLSERNRTLFRRDEIGFIFQFFNLIPTLTVLENVLLPQELAGRRTRDIVAAGLDLLDKVGLVDRRDTFPDKLSGGEQQRVAIARALAHNPTIILADEPTGNLDVGTGELVMDLLLGLTRDAGRTLIMVTHSRRMVPLADRVLRVRNGSLIETSVAEEIPAELQNTPPEPAAT